MILPDVRRGPQHGKVATWVENDASGRSGYRRR